MRSTSFFVGALVALVATPALSQQSGRDSTGRDTTVIRLTPITVTATRTETDVFAVPTPVTVLPATAIAERHANSVTDLFRSLPGLDVAGVGTTQPRPVIRGQRGQRILLLSDGLRLNNSRRQQDFGEIPSLVDVAGVDRVEIVRGPASVLYGSDAIGGVVNIITKRPERDGLHGSAMYRYSTHDDQQNAHGSLDGRFGAFSFRGRAGVRNAGAYSAPSGSFGNITLANDTPVEDTGVEDYSLDGYLGYRFAPGHDAFVKVERYVADSAGFGFVDPAAYAPGQPDIIIGYPMQRFTKVAAGYTGIGLSAPFADRVDVTGYWQDNRRKLNFDIFIPVTGAPPPGPDSILSTQRSYAEVATVGGRLELKKFVNSALAFTYGADVFRDATDNVDTSTTVAYFLFGPAPSTAAVPQVPNSTFRSLGVFFQSELTVADGARIIAGGRYQDVKASAKLTDGVTLPAEESTDRTFVGAVNGIVDVGRHVSLIGSVGRAFRSPNLIERFFQGPTPEGFGYQIRNPGLEAETSLNVDFGARYRDGVLFAEGFVFQNTVSDAIRIEAAGTVDETTGLPEFRNVNVDKLRARGVELAADVRLPAGVTVGSNFTHLDTENITEDQNNPIGDGFSSQVNGFLRYDAPANRFFGEYRVRHNFERDDAEIFPGNPIGETLPAFTTHDVVAGVRLAPRGGTEHRVILSVTNLTDALYAEFSNVSFFRPEPGRRLTVSYGLVF